MKSADDIKNALRLCFDREAMCPSECPYFDSVECKRELMRDALESIKGLEIQLTMYHKADTFLAAHGWTWGETNAGSKRESVQIVRCRDCVYYEQYSNKNGGVGRCSYHERVIESGSFCNHGLRPKEEG